MSIDPKLIARYARRGIDLEAAIAPKEGVLEEVDSIAREVALDLLAKQRELGSYHEQCVVETRKEFSLLTLAPLEACQEELAAKVSGDEVFVASLREVAISEASEVKMVMKPLADHEERLIDVGPKRIK